MEDAALSKVSHVHLLTCFVPALFFDVWKQIRTLAANNGDMFKLSVQSKSFGSVVEHLKFIDL